MKEQKTYFSHEHPLRFAHRGSRILWPENTMTAFQGAVDAGCIYIESDMHVTGDGVIVTFHDDVLENLTDGKGKIKDWQWPDLRTLDAAYFFKPEEDYPLRNSGIGIPSLEEVMKTFPHVMLNLDLKQPGIEQNVARFITAHHFEDRVLLASFNNRRVRRCRRLLQNRVATSAGPREVALSWAYSRVGKACKIAADALQVPVHKGPVRVVDKKLIEAAHASGLQVHVWTIDNPAEMRRLLDLGVDGIVTDRIDLLNEVLADRSVSSAKSVVY